MAAYRLPWAASDDANAMIKVMEKIREENSSHFIMGGFNLTDINWITLDWKELNSVHGKFLAYFEQEDLSQIVSHPTRGDDILDTALLTKGLQTCSPKCVPPCAHSDHWGRLVNLAYMYNPKRASTYHCSFTKNYNKTNFYMEQQLLARVNWSVILANAADVDDYVVRFKKIFKETIDNYIPVCKIFKKKHKQRCPKHIMKLIYSKRREWKKRASLKTMHYIKCVINVLRTL